MDSGQSHPYQAEQAAVSAIQLLQSLIKYQLYSMHDGPALLDGRQVCVLSLVRWEDSDADVFILSRLEEFMPEKEGKLLRSSQYSTSNKVVQVKQVLSKQKFLP